MSRKPDLPNPHGLHLGASLAIALKAIRTNSIRSLLTMLGIIIGIAAAIVSVSISQGAGRQLQEQIESFGTHVLQVFPGSGFFGGRRGAAGTARPLTDRDLEAIIELTGSVEAASGRVQTGATLVAAGRNWPSNIIGVNLDFDRIDNRQIVEGRGFTPAEIRSGDKLAILGPTVARELFAGSSPIGQRLRIGRTPVTAIGLLDEKGASSWGQDQDDVVWMPLSAVRTRLARGASTVPDDVGSIRVKVWDDRDVLEVQQEIEDLLRLRRKLQPGAEDDFRVVNFAEFIRARNQTESLLGFLLAAFSATSLVVGGIGIMNIMLVSVTERTREIGLRKAVGARRRDILWQFLTEAVMLSTFGGGIGIALGAAGAQAISYVLRDEGFRAVMTIGAVMLATLFSAAVGLFFGIYPAQRAAGLNPIDALRYE